ncbi:LPS-assembly protein [Tranquillimonas rosea]|uniref:LPS-assembly protein LptD n=1 Tax=Tranquillimonas rosea TaxID=641238 RepID=A0A1H9PJR1_9RHOB|nr:LPS assembly protein LptD [Tranquillimonas rosea]SER48428.1 LPS-assembly protein [Tranquillimonas rosea]
MRLRVVLALLGWLIPALAEAQTASLVADRVDLRGGDTLVAEGSVEVLYGRTRLSAPRITYDQTADRLRIEGPITLVEGESTIVVADQAQLDTDLQNGILDSARLVLDRQLQLAANQITRVDGRYTLLTKSVASSCRVCAAAPVPTWEIRARRIIHDEQAQQLYFDSASFRLLGIPIFYVPRLRLPDPTLARSTGFLLPTVRSTSALGTGVKVPYFVTVGDHADLTFTPYLSPQTRTLQARWRQETVRGGLSFEGALSDDTLREDETRYYLFGNGSFTVGAGFTLDVGLQQVSDPAYLIDYDYSDRDRLVSFAELSRYRRDEAIFARITGFETLRDSEIPIEDQLPRSYAQFAFERSHDVAGGVLTWGADAAAVRRKSDAPGAGRDSQRVGLSTDWRRQETLPNGMIAALTTGVAGHVYNTRQDPTFDDQTGRLTTSAEATLRWPMRRVTAGGAQQLLEPVVQLAWADVIGDTVPNEDSVLVEFDEGNLFSLSRYPGRDRIETGARANLGVRFTHLAPGGWTLGALVGRTARFDETGQFEDGTGLSGESSDWLVAGQLRLNEMFSLTGRTLFEDDLTVTKAAARMAYSTPRAQAAATYVWLREEPDENRPDPAHEVTLDAAYRLTRRWSSSFETRFNVEAERAAEAGLGLQYRTECITVDLSLSRRFTSSTSVSATTDFGLEVSLAGIGADRTGAAARSACNG